MLPHEVWEGSSATARIIRGLATPLSWLYAGGWEAYLGAYSLGLKRAASPHKPIICVGSLVVGGSGKSPVTMHVAKVLQDMGKQVVIGCSGYGFPHAEAATMAPAGPLAAAEWGDEPAMIRWLLPEFPIVVGRKRVQAASLVHQRYPAAALVMDDGFQHLPLAKQLTLVLDDPEPRNSKCLPAGPYREPRRNRRRADLVIPGEIRLKREPLRIVTPDGEGVVPTSYSVLCALGDPSRFQKGLAERFPNALAEVPTCLLSDHDPLMATDLLESLPSKFPVIVTAKDWVKLRERADVHNREFLIALQEVGLEPRREFEAWLERSFNE